MEYFQKKPSQAGVRPSRETHRLISHGTVVVGQICAVNLSTALTSPDYFATGSRTAPAGTNEGTIWVVALEAGTVGQSLEFGFRGVFNVTDDGTGFSANDKLTVSGSGGEVVVATAGNVVIALAVEDVAADATGPVWFDGSGFSSSMA